ncbi:hypothetical protein [Desulfobulbus alkaliphilus]|uniref:hypothetical protein n=1 Tax=Desulfobulbus alkaliphilus TaxID=869814 RepID=UPI0019649B92|nr:hypothetical protein [Desulfobulbus alkaliphilus]MBM9536231.1 hypothetical protein [Desulfobulbus alkaliphilus]
MNLTLRRIVAAYALVALALAWWFPAPMMIRGDLVDWAQRYEARYAPPKTQWGAMEAGRAFIQSVTPPVPLARFIEQQVEGQVYQADNPSWAEVFAGLEQDKGHGGRTLHYERPSDQPFTELDTGLRFVEWRDEQGIRHMEYRFLTANEYGDQPIPTSMRFPLREYGLFLLIGGLGLGCWGISGRGGDDLILTSTAAMGVRWSAFCAAIFSGLLLWPFIHQTVGSDFSFASILIGSLLFCGALVGVWLFSKQRAMIKALIQDGISLAHFTYSPEEWLRFTQWDHAEQFSEKRSLFVVMFTTCLVVGLGFMVVMRDAASVWVFGLLMSFITLIGVLFLLLPRFIHRRNVRRPGQIFIGAQGIYLNGSVHSWNTWGARFESAEYYEKPLPHILLSYSQLQLAGKSLHQSFRHHVQLRVPIPVGRADLGRRVAEQLVQANRS